jgi:hypothetical protein
MSIQFHNFSDKVLFNKIQYVWETFLEYLNYDGTGSQKNIRIAYSPYPAENKDFDIIIYSKESSENYFKVKQEFPVEKVKFFHFNDEKIPLLFYSGQEEILFKTNDQNPKIEIFGDIFLSAFYFLSLWQEYSSEKRDRHNRFCGIDSIQNKLGLLTIPIVNQYFIFLKDILISYFDFNDLHIKHYKEKDFAIGISHDIDYIRKWTLGIIYREVIKLFILI